MPKVSSEPLVEVISISATVLALLVKGTSNSVVSNLLGWWDSNEVMSKYFINSPL